MKNYTDITILLDRSGSMSAIKSGMESGFSAFLEGHKAVPSTRVTLVEFDSPTGQYHDLTSGIDLHTVYTAKPVSEVPPLQLIPRGGTPLLEAMCDTIDATGKRLAALRESDRPRGVLFVVITDGEENMSRAKTRTDVFGRVKHQEAAYNWQFIYLGANQDAIVEAARMGIKPQNALDYGFTSTGSGTAMRAATVNTVSYATQTATGQWAKPSLLNFTVEQKMDAADTDEALKKKAKQPLTPPAGIGG